MTVTSKKKKKKKEKKKEEHCRFSEAVRKERVNQIKSERNTTKRNARKNHASRNTRRWAGCGVCGGNPVTGLVTSGCPWASARGGRGAARGAYHYVTHQTLTRRVFIARTSRWRGVGLSRESRYGGRDGGTSAARGTGHWVGRD